MQLAFFLFFLLYLTAVLVLLFVIDTHMHVHTHTSYSLRTSHTFMHGTHNLDASGLEQTRFVSCDAWCVHRRRMRWKTMKNGPHRPIVEMVRIGCDALKKHVRRRRTHMVGFRWFCLLFFIFFYFFFFAFRLGFISWLFKNSNVYSRKSVVVWSSSSKHIYLFVGWGFHLHWDCLRFEL